MQGIEPERNETNNYQICELGGFTLSLADKSYECRIKQIRANFKVRDGIVDFSINLLSMSCYRSRRDKVLWYHTYGSQQLELVRRRRQS